MRMVSIDTITDAPLPAAMRAGRCYEPPPLPSEKVTLDRDAVRALRPDCTDSQILRHGLGDNSGYMPKTTKRWQAESLAVWLGCEPAEIIIEDRPKEVIEMDARNTPVKCTYCGKTCGGSAGKTSHERACSKNPANAKVQVPEVIRRCVLCRAVLAKSEVDYCAQHAKDAAPKPVCDDCGATGELSALWSRTCGEVRTVCQDCGAGEDYTEDRPLDEPTVSEEVPVVSVDGSGEIVDEGHITLADLVADGIDVRLVPIDESRALRLELIDANLELVVADLVADRFEESERMLSRLDRVRELVAQVAS